jgi:hypothetical protein
MNRLVAALSISTFTLAVCFAGCSKSSTQQPAASTASSSSLPSPSSSAPATSASEASNAERSERAPKPRQLVVPADTELRVVLDEELGSKISSTGQTFTATVEAPIEVDGRVAIPRDARVTGIVKDAKAAGRFKGGSHLELALTSVTLHNRDYELQTSDPTFNGKGKGKRTAEMVGGGAGGGAAIGAVAGGGKGAAIGALIGAVAGAGGAGFTGNRDITLPAESSLTFKLLRPVEIHEK